ncbi:MAG: hypothetical protein GY742_02575 [Hyphomicrobiales bacterium]|nr:hypothetical protein [Hyphomicrobiales bacterium]
MADGSKKPISQIEVGDEVLAADPETGESGARVVVATIPHNDQLLTLRTSAGEIVTTEDHLYWNQTDSEWQESQLLGLGDRLLAADGDVVVVEGLDWSTVHIDAAYDLDVAGFDTFYVGAGDEAVLVHNIECPWQLKTDDIYGNQILGGDVHKFDSSVLRELTPSQLRGLQTDLTASIANRTDNLLNPNAAAGHNDMSQIWLDHADRLLDEKRLLTQVERMLG